jgi:hypothetical protein
MAAIATFIEFIKKLSVWAVIDILAFSVFWALILVGFFDEFDTMVFFEPTFTYFLIGTSLLTGMLIGCLSERYIQQVQS